MDFSIRHWAPYPRRHASLFPLATLGHEVRKAHWMRTAFSSCNFSLILGGRGEFHRSGRLWPVEAPCVLTQWPGQHLEYGPTGQSGTWHELYLIYDASLFPLLQKSHLIDTERPVWPITNLPAVQVQIDELASLSRSRHPEEVVDRVDRVCERLVLETWLRPPGGLESEAATVIQGIVQELRQDLAGEIDLDALALRHKMSPATFRRRWGEVVSVPPARYRLQLRLREACRLLAETTRPIREVARMVGFQDELYFSRRFRQEMKLAPRTYRRMYQIQRD